MAKKQRIRRSDSPVSPLADWAPLFALLAPVAQARPSLDVSPGQLSDEEEKSVVASARILKGLGLEPADVFSSEARAEAYSRVLRGTEGLDDEDLLRRILPQHIAGLPIDFLDAPSLRAHLKHLRLPRKEGRSGVEAAALTRCAKALRFSRHRGAPVRPDWQIIVDLFDDSTYLSLYKEFAARTGTPFKKFKPKLGPFWRPTSGTDLSGARHRRKLGTKTALDETIEVALKRQVDAFNRDRRRGRLMPAERVALAFLEVQEGKPSSDGDLERAMKGVRSLERNVGLALDRARVKKKSRT